jgi:nicotinamide-nucleotide amidase
MSQLVENVSAVLRAQGLKLATAESCTGGMIAAAITDLSGSSDIFDRGFVTYSNQSKIDLLGVLPETLEAYGAVSEQTAGEMVIGALSRSGADLSVAVTGIAGPSGGSAEKPVGLVYIGIGRKGSKPSVHRHVFPGGRSEVRQQAAQTALRHLADFIQPRIA